MARNLLNNLEKLNRWVAIKGTEAFSSMWMCYLFFAWSVLAFIPQLDKYKELILLVSSASIQLWALPLISVGNSVMGERIERRAQRDHEMILQEFALLKEDHALLGEILEILRKLDKRFN